MANAFSKEFSFPALKLDAVCAKHDYAIMLFQRQLHPWEKMLISNKKPLTALQEHYRTILDISFVWAKEEWLRSISSPLVLSHSMGHYWQNSCSYSLSLAVFREQVFSELLQYEKKPVDCTGPSGNCRIDLNVVAQTFRKELKKHLGRGAAKCDVHLLTETRSGLCFLAEGILSDGQKEVVQENNSGRQSLEAILKIGFLKSMLASLCCSSKVAVSTAHCSIFLEHDRAVGYVDQRSQ
jgi:hypothetical protein